MGLSISIGNSKLGAIPSVSFPPGVGCAPDVPCRSDCYAVKAWRQYPSVRKSWAGNHSMALQSPGDFFEGILAWVTKRKPNRFRFHVSGDILDYEYLKWMVWAAEAAKGTRFLAFTKRYDFVNAYLNTAELPANLTIILSAWPGHYLKNPHGLTVAWMQDGTETRVPPGAVECAGHCSNCSACWDSFHDVVFNKH